MCGMVLMKKNRYPGHFPGTWNFRWEKANENEAQEFLADHAILLNHKELVGEIKKTNPELLI